MSQVRVRFAPSPTGFVHIGSLRTALYNYLFARKNNGSVVLRIEDTDQKRFVEGAVDNILDAMDWAGIGFDESLRHGGDFGPYLQSERTDIYRQHVQMLLDKGNAYPCFCSAATLEKMREEQIARGEDPKYDGRCRNIPKDEAAARMADEEHVIRLKIPKGRTVVEDIVRGRVEFDNDLLDDQVLMKSDGYPTYHLANVVDDHLMRISHVIRGEEWLPSTPKHVILYKCFGWDVPQFAHLPLLLNPDRSKLSKRQGDVAVEDYMKKGYLPEALVNFVALLGWNPGEGSDQELFTLDELEELFSLERVSKAGAVFDINKLDWMNGHYLRELPRERQLELLQPVLQKSGIDTSDTAKTEKIVEAVVPRINKISDAPFVAAIFASNELVVQENDALEILKQESTRTVLSEFISRAGQLSGLTPDSFKDVMKSIQKEKGIKGPQLWKPVRVALTGSLSGPELPLVIDIFGKDKAISFARQALEKYAG